MQSVSLTATAPGAPAARWRCTRFGAGTGGQALVEFALTLPLLLLIVTGMLSFGVALHDYLELADAVSIGARLLAVSRGETTDPCSAASTAVSNAAPLLTSSKITYSIVLNGTSYGGTSCSSLSTTTGAAGNLVQGTSATLTATYPCNLSVYGNVLPNCTLTAQATELIQ